MAEPVCPYCRMPFDGTVPARIFCTACGTPHHEDCYAENGGCTVFGCARAPADDPKLQVSYSELSSVTLPQAYASQPQAYAASAPVHAAQYAAPNYSGPLGLSAAAQSAAAVAPQGYPPAYGQPVPRVARSEKSRATFVVLGIFLGALGIHNFYAGYTGRAVGQLCLTVFTLGYLGVAAWIWAIIEICIVTRDSAGLDFS